MFDWVIITRHKVAWLHIYELGSRLHKVHSIKLKLFMLYFNPLETSKWQVVMQEFTINHYHSRFLNINLLLWKSNKCFIKKKEQTTTLKIIELWANSEHRKVISMMNTLSKTKQAKNCSFLNNCLLEPKKTLFFLGSNKQLFRKEQCLIKWSTSCGLPHLPQPGRGLRFFLFQLRSSPEHVLFL